MGKKKIIKRSSLIVSLFLGLAIIGLLFILYGLIMMLLVVFHALAINSIYVGPPFIVGLILFVLSIVVFIKNIPWF